VNTFLGAKRDDDTARQIGTEGNAMPSFSEPSTHKLTADDGTSVRQLAASLAERYQSAESPDFLADVTVHAHALPFPLRRFLNAFRLSADESAVALISGYPLEDGNIGPTPSQRGDTPSLSPTLADDIYLMLCGALVGDVFGWATQQDGFLIHDILPVKECEYDQVGASSQGTLHWHTEDAFHPYRADHVGLFCLRNPLRTATTWGSLDLSLLSSVEIEILFQARYTILADDSHKREHEDWRGPAQGALDEAYRAREATDRKSEKVPLLRGHREDPDLCVDPVYMEPPIDDPEAARALAALTSAIQHNIQELVLSPGDLFIINNTKAVHGRQPFTAGYDGTDRWLKRINLMSDLRKSRDARIGAASRVIL